MTLSTLPACLDSVKYPRDVDLVGVTEIAEMLGVSKQRADQLAKRTDFPEPEASLAAGRIWSRADIERWAAETGRIVDAE